MFCQKDAFMCAEESVKLEMHFRKKLGEGFILQKISGPGTAFVEIPGEVRKIELKSGEMIKVDPGHIAVFEPTVEYDITGVKGLKECPFLWGRFIPGNINWSRNCLAADLTFIKSSSEIGKIHANKIWLINIKVKIKRNSEVPRFTM